ncbi:MAG: hypothetical protein JW804_02565 [Sedimentisphaerales bacterium]|nr:hypothetical protein [Sedimentisphaerales bacterium]
MTDKNEISNLPIAVREFIKLIIKKMRYRKKVQREVRAELVAHFEDELKEYQGKERDEKTKQLIQDFGDVKLLGLLLRRAKKRCRPLWRTAVARTFQAIGIFILLLAVYIGWFLSGKPIITTNYVEVINKRVKPFAGVDPNLNASSLYCKAAETLEQMEKDERIPKEIDELFGKKYVDLTSEQREVIDKWLKKNNHLLELVAEGSKLPYYWPELNTGQKNSTELISILMPYLSSYREFAYMLTHWRAEKKAQEGQFQQAFDDVLICYRMGRHFKNSMTLVEQLVGIAIEALATNEIAEILSRYEIESEILAGLQSDFEKLIADENYTTDFKGERYFIYDEIQRSFTASRIGGGHLYLKRVNQYGTILGTDFEQNKFKLLIKLLFLHPNKQETLDAVDNFYDRMEQLASMSPAKKKAENIDINKEFEQYCKGNMFLEILAPALGEMIRTGYRNEAQIQATPLIVAIHRYKQDFGNLPDNLDEVEKSGYIKHLPIDPFSDKPLVYKKTDDGFTLYSVGYNFKDDNGDVYRDKDGRVRLWNDDEGDAVFWPVQK